MEEVSTTAFVRLPEFKEGRYIVYGASLFFLLSLFTPLISLETITDGKVRIYLFEVFLKGELLFPVLTVVSLVLAIISSILISFYNLRNLSYVFALTAAVSGMWTIIRIISSFPYFREEFDLTQDKFLIWHKSTVMGIGGYFLLIGSLLMIMAVISSISHYKSMMRKLL